MLPLKAAKVKLAKKQKLLEKAKEKLRKAEALVLKAEQEVKSAEKEYAAAELQVENGNKRKRKTWGTRRVRGIEEEHSKWQDLHHPCHPMLG